MATVNKLPADYVDYLCHPGKGMVCYSFPLDETES